MGIVEKHKFNMSDPDLRMWIYEQYMLRGSKSRREYLGDGKAIYHDLTHDELLTSMEQAFKWIKGI